jgi:hypothetical protein
VRWIPTQFSKDYTLHINPSLETDYCPWNSLVCPEESLGKRSFFMHIALCSTYYRCEIYSMESSEDSYWTQFYTLYNLRITDGLHFIDRKCPKPFEMERECEIHDIQHILSDAGTIKDFW